MRNLIFRQLCHLGFLSLLSTESTDNTSDTTPLFQSDMIDTGLINFTHFLNYIRKHVDRLAIRAGKKNLQNSFFLFYRNYYDYFSEHFTTIP